MGRQEAAEGSDDQRKSDTDQDSLGAHHTVVDQNVGSSCANMRFEPSACSIASLNSRSFIFCRRSFQFVQLNSAKCIRVVPLLAQVTLILGHFTHT